MERKTREMIAISCHSTLWLSRPLILASYSDAKALIFCRWPSSLYLGPTATEAVWPCISCQPGLVSRDFPAKGRVHKWSRSPNSTHWFNYAFRYQAILVQMSTLPTLYMLSPHPSFVSWILWVNKNIPPSQSYEWCEAESSEKAVFCSVQGNIFCSLLWAEQRRNSWAPVGCWYPLTPKHPLPPFWCPFLPGEYLRSYVWRDFVQKGIQSKTDADRFQFLTLSKALAFLSLISPFGLHFAKFKDHSWPLLLCALVLAPKNKMIFHLRLWRYECWSEALGWHVLGWVPTTCSFDNHCEVPTVCQPLCCSH